MMCPNCGRTYIGGGTPIYYCLNCNHRLIDGKNIKQVAHPELNEHKIIGRVVVKSERTSEPIDKPTIECPYCHSADTKKISGTSRWLSTGLFGLASNKIGKNFHCNKCGADF